MGADIKRENECFQQDYDKLYAKGTWTPEEVKTMKDLKKLIYYNLAIQAMEKGSAGYSDEEYSPEMSYARGRGNRSGMHPHYPDEGGGMYYDGGGNGRSGTNYYDGGSNRSGRRYFDSEKERAMSTLHRMMENSDDPERRNALRMAIQELETK